MSESVSAPRRSKTTTAASFSVVMLVSYLALVHLKAILMPLAIAILLYFLIRAPEKFLFEKVGNSVISYALILAFSVLLASGGAGGAPPGRGGWDGWIVRGSY